MPVRDLSDLKILVVDDQAAVRRVIARLLAQLGASRVESAGDGAEAMRAIEAATEPFDVAICDLSMPTEDGLVLLRRLAALHRKPAVILMSGKDALVLESAQRLGDSLDVTILGTIAKPLTGSTLTTMLDVLNRPDAKIRHLAPTILTCAEVEHCLDTDRFELWFQPQYHIASGRVIGVEALLRVRQGERGILEPESFIGTAERCGLIGRLTDVVMERATRWCAEWQSAGWPLTVAVNLSKAGLDDLTLPDRAAALCERWGLAPGQLAFELTESSLAADNSALLEVTTRLRLKGFHLSLDDFGTGYASLEELRSLPFNELKLDKQFVQSAGDNPRSRTILENACRLASKLKISTVAEGVETLEMLRLVAGLGCQVAQGYLIGRPMPAEEVLGWLIRGGASRDASLSDRLRPVAGPEGDQGPAHRQVETESALLGEAIVRFAHDIASPLMMVLAMSEMLASDDSVGAGHRDDLNQIHAAAQDVSAMIKALRKQALETKGARSAAAKDRPGTSLGG